MKERWLYPGFLVLLGLGWGSTQPLGKIAASTGHKPFGLIFWQLLVCVVVLGGLTLLRGDPMLVVQALQLSRAITRRIRQNLFWAFAYNVVGIPLAAIGLLSPVVAGAAMALSSVSVVSNALLLGRFKPRS